MLGRLWLLARGQVRVRVTGASLPRFLNLCAFHGLTLRHMKRTAWNGCGFPRAAAVYGADRLSGTHCAAAGRAFYGGAPAAALCAVGWFSAACAHLLAAVYPCLGD